MWHLYKCALPLLKLKQPQNALRMVLDNTTFSHHRLNILIIADLTPQNVGMIQIAWYWSWLPVSGPSTKHHAILWNSRPHAWKRLDCITMICSYYTRRAACKTLAFTTVQLTHYSATYQNLLAFSVNIHLNSPKTRKKSFKFNSEFNITWLTPCVNVAIEPIPLPREWQYGESI